MMGKVGVRGTILVTCPPHPMGHREHRWLPTKYICLFRNCIPHAGALLFDDMYCGRGQADCASVGILHLEPILGVVMHRPVLAHYHLCHGANLTSVHGLSVKRRDGHDAARRAREKNLITVVRHVNGHNLTTDREPRILCNLKNALPSDALETAAIGCVDDAIIHQQYVEGGSLGEVAVPVGKHGVRRAAVLRLEHGSHKIPPLQALGRRVYGPWRHATYGSSDDCTPARGLLHAVSHDPGVRLGKHVQIVDHSIRGELSCVDDAFRDNHLG
ncbi:hypothetical protein VFPFJ_09544 [Purpureocillium lilacinum]|uniref:Uncharacterized protein n=1 Tax=Purpureocillium lilacinum TaxID=33203 RepID=A0A179GVB4_PURLI|nr:hypothetical protein VFPFJ_09544 [Purpureocillium lilacinum]OAQ81089.1 hypothetical protein VFPFJ_09544 [Purpureocillium lilacinum]